MYFFLPVRRSQLWTVALDATEYRSRCQLRTVLPREARLGNMHETGNWKIQGRREQDMEVETQMATMRQRNDKLWSLKSGKR